jgi:hypothetical protein
MITKGDQDPQHYADAVARIALGSRADVDLQRRYVWDLAASARATMASLDPTPFFQKYGPTGNSWAIFKAYLDAASQQAAEPIVAKYTGKLAAADVFTVDNAYVMFESLASTIEYSDRSATTHSHAGLLAEPPPPGAPPPGEDAAPESGERRLATGVGGEEAELAGDLDSGRVRRQKAQNAQLGRRELPF